MQRTCLRTLFVFILMLTGLFGQNLSIQGVARDNTGQSLSDGGYQFTFRLYSPNSDGDLVWTEDQNLDVLNGVFSTVLGDVSSMAGLDFNNEYWLSLEIDGNGELEGRTKLILSPYAIMAGLSGTTNVFPESGSVGVGTTAPTSTLHIKNGTSNTRLTIERDSEGDEAFLQYRTAGQNKALIGLDNNNTNLSFFAYGGPGTMGAFNTTTGNFGLGTTRPTAKLHVDGNVQVDGKIIGGFGAKHWQETGGYDWNDSLNVRSGSGYTLLYGDREGGPGPNTLFHSFGFEYNNSGNITQLAIPYSHSNHLGSGLFYRGRYYGDWNDWRRILTAEPDGEVDIDGELNVAGSLDIDSWKTQSLSANGYVRMGGLIFQWGVFECDEDDDQTESFPMNFPTACFGVYSNRAESNVESPITVRAWTTTGFTVNRDNSIGGSETVNWFAVGH